MGLRSRGGFSLHPQTQNTPSSVHASYRVRFVSLYEKIQRTTGIINIFFYLVLVLFVNSSLIFILFDFSPHSFIASFSWGFSDCLFRICYLHSREINSRFIVRLVECDVRSPFRCKTIDRHKSQIFHAVFFNFCSNINIMRDYAVSTLRRHRQLLSPLLLLHTIQVPDLSLASISSKSIQNDNLRTFSSPSRLSCSFYSLLVRCVAKRRLMVQKSHGKSSRSTVIEITVAAVAVAILKWNYWAKFKSEHFIVFSPSAYALVDVCVAVHSLGLSDRTNRTSTKCIKTIHETLEVDCSIRSMAAVDRRSCAQTLEVDEKEEKNVTKRKHIAIAK